MRIFRLSAIPAILFLLSGFIAAQTNITNWQLKPFLSGLSAPVLITNAKDGSKRLFVVQQRGIIKVVPVGSTTPTDFLNITSLVSQTGSERGLLGLTFHPQFSTNGYFFVNYTRTSDGTTVISRFKAINNNSVGDPNSERILLTIPQPFSNHNGGMIEFGPDGFLYIGTGDGGSANDPGARAQNINELLGKMLRIAPDVSGNDSNPPYTNPPDNPYVGVAGADEIYAIGLRNPWRWSFDRGGTRQLWAGDVGQGALEEVDVITKGGNFGWRVYEGSQCTNLDSQLCVGGTTPITQVSPVYEYANAGSDRCAVTGGYVYRGTRRTFASGTYLYADYCTGEIWRGGSATPIIDTDRLISSFGEDEDGEIYVVGLGGTIDRFVANEAVADFDGDARTDIAVFRSSNGVWYITNSSNNSFRSQQFGQNGDIPTAEDYDGDNITDIAVYRPSAGSFYVFLSTTNSFSAFQWGGASDIPVEGDYDGDNRADYAVFRPADGTWYIRNSSNGSFNFQRFGQAGDLPLVGDYDGDGRADITVFRPSNGTWYRLNSSNGSFFATQFGFGSDLPTVGDFDGDGKADISVFRPSNGAWYRFNSSNGSFFATQFGQNGDLPTVGDYDGDGKSDISVFRPSNGAWYRLNSTNGSFFATQFGQNGDFPSTAYYYQLP